MHRYGHSAVLFGADMLVFGFIYTLFFLFFILFYIIHILHLYFSGSNLECCMSDLWILDLVCNMIVLFCSCEYLICVFNQEINKWIPIDIMGVVPPPRHRHSALRFGNKMVIFAGCSVGKDGFLIHTNLF